MCRTLRAVVWVSGLGFRHGESKMSRSPLILGIVGWPGTCALGIGTWAASQL